MCPLTQSYKQTSSSALPPYTQRVYLIKYASHKKGGPMNLIPKYLKLVSNAEECRACIERKCCCKCNATGTGRPIRLPRNQHNHPTMSCFSYLILYRAESGEFSFHMNPPSPITPTLPLQPHRLSGVDPAPPRRPGLSSSNPYSLLVLRLPSRPELELALV